MISIFNIKVVVIIMLVSIINFWLLSLIYFSYMYWIFEIIYFLTQTTLTQSSNCLILRSPESFFT